MTSHQNTSRLCSKDELIEIIERLLALEFSRTGSPWVSNHRLCKLFSIGYGLDLKFLVEVEGYGKDVKSLLVGSKRFSIYNDNSPDTFLGKR